MHNCKVEQERLREMALRSVRPLPDELAVCVSCREEYLALCNALRITDQAMQVALPPEDFWPQYRAGLRHRLQRSQVETETRAAEVRPPFWQGFFARSVPVPIPVALLTLLVLGAAIFVAARTARRPASPAEVVTRTIQVPQIQEKIITKVVYRNANPAPARLARQNRAVTTPARNRQTDPEQNSLAGFKPAGEVNLTIIKGTDHDQK